MSSSTSTRQELMLLVQDIATPSPWRYWIEVIVSSILIWGSAYIATFEISAFWLAMVFAVGILTSYRALLLSHEIFHLKRGTIPGLRIVWQIFIGIPFLFPLFFVRCHADHHALNRYGTLHDPEYLPFASEPRYRRFFLVAGVFFPFLLVVRALFLVPLAIFWPTLRIWLDLRFSSLVMNRAYQAKPLNGAEARFAEAATTLYAWSLLFGTATSLMNSRLPFFFLICLIASNTLNASRTLRAHKYSGFKLRTFEEQIADSEIEKAPWFFAETIAPIGHRFHAVHHALPSLPFHSLREAHRRLIKHNHIKE